MITANEARKLNIEYNLHLINDVIEPTVNSLLEKCDNSIAENASRGHSETTIIETYPNIEKETSLQLIENSTVRHLKENGFKIDSSVRPHTIRITIKW